MLKDCARTRADTVDETVNYLREYLDKLASENSDPNEAMTEEVNGTDMCAVRSLAR